MNDLKEVLLYHAAKYPKMQAQDGVKLLYQNEFGGGHMITDEKSSLERLIREAAAVEPEAEVPLCVDIGNGSVRINLASRQFAEAAFTTVNRFFIESSKCAKGTMASFTEKLALLRQLSENGSLPFTRAALSEYLDAYQAAGCPAVSHSELYRTSYRPAYRVVSSAYAKYFTLFSSIDKLLREKSRTVVAIDGRCGSGKTTLAGLLAGIYDCTVIHMDDFFLPLALRTEARLAEAGGNVDYERFAAEAATGLRSGAPFTYRIFDCATMDFSGVAAISPKALTIVEGSYSLHPKIGPLFGLTVFLTVSDKEQKRRILCRNGESRYRSFAEKWIPMENKYFEAYGIPEQCDLLFDTTQKTPGTA